MSHNIIENNSNPNGQQVDLGNGQLVSMQVVQQIYNEITGKSETLSRPYSLNHRVEFEDFRQLNIKIDQICEQYNIISKNCSVTIFHVDDQRQNFSSFERFELFDRSTLSPVESVRLEYNFLIVLPRVQKPQSYVVEINIRSRAAMAQRERRESKLPPGRFYEFIAPITAYVDIEYVDYTVARTLQVTIDGWFKGLHIFPASKFLGLLKKGSHYISSVIPAVAVTAFIAICYVIFGSAKWAHPDGFKSLYIALLFTLGGSLIIGRFAHIFGVIIVNSVLRIQQKSFINLTRGDQLALEELSNINRQRWGYIIFSMVITVLLNVFSAWIAIRLGIT